MLTVDKAEYEKGSGRHRHSGRQGGKCLDVFGYRREVRVRLYKDAEADLEMRFVFQARVGGCMWAQSGRWLLLDPDLFVGEPRCHL